MRIAIFISVQKKVSKIMMLAAAACCHTGPRSLLVPSGRARGRGAIEPARPGFDAAAGGRVRELRRGGWAVAGVADLITTG